MIPLYPAAGDFNTNAMMMGSRRLPSQPVAPSSNAAPHSQVPRLVPLSLNYSSIDQADMDRLDNSMYADNDRDRAQKRFYQI